MQATGNIGCPRCQRMLKVTKRLGGRELTYPSCGHAFVVGEVGDVSSRASGGASEASDTCQALDTTETDAPARPATVGYLGRCALTRILGQGAFGRVYQAHDPQLDRTMALKVPMCDARDQAVRSLALLADGQAIAVTGADGVVRVFEGAVEGTPAHELSPKVAAPMRPSTDKSTTTETKEP
jgi:hypothetical protein